MDEHTDIAAAQWQVQRWLGRCVLVLQQYEGLMKNINAHRELSGAASELSQIKQARIEALATKTLGQSAGEFVGSFLVKGDRAPVEPASGYGTGDVASISFRINMCLPEADYIQTQASMKELVELRNALVHHFIERFDLWSIEGCEKAHAYLQGVYVRIFEHYTQLRAYAGEMKETMDQMAAFLQSDAGIDIYSLTEFLPMGKFTGPPPASWGRCTQQCVRWPLMVGPRSTPRSSGSLSTIPSNNPPSTAAAVGRRYCTSRGASNCVIASPRMTRAAPGSGPGSDDFSPAFRAWPLRLDPRNARKSPRRAGSNSAIGPYDAVALG